jgi:hypothetical protein
MTRFHSLPDNCHTAMTTTTSLLGITPRQRPCTDRFDDLMVLAEATARAIEDNAWDEGQPLPQAFANAWGKQLDNIRQAIHNATLARAFELEGK